MKKGLKCKLCSLIDRI